MKKIIYGAIGALAVSLVFVVMAFANNEIVATVGNVEIGKEIFYEELVELYGTETLDMLITEEVIRQEAESMNAEVTQDEIDTELAEYTETYGGTEALEEALSSSGMTTGDLVAEIENYLVIEKLAGSEINITEDEITAYFEENKTSFDQTAQVEASHILVATREEAEVVKEKLDAGGDFAELAAEYSTDTATAELGGELGAFGTGEMAEEFEEAAFSMGVGEISNPVGTDYGFHIIQVTQKTEAVEAVLKDVHDEIHDILFDEALSTAYTTWMTETTASYDISNSLTEESE